MSSAEIPRFSSQSYLPLMKSNEKTPNVGLPMHGGAAHVRASCEGAARAARGAGAWPAFLFTKLTIHRSHLSRCQEVKKRFGRPDGSGAPLNCLYCLVNDLVKCVGDPLDRAIER